MSKMAEAQHMAAASLQAEDILQQALQTVTEETKGNAIAFKNDHTFAARGDTKITVSTVRLGCDGARIILPAKCSTAPLGSSENPIQIIQQGNTYHSTQMLNHEQLQQIAHVLQQQQLTSRATHDGGSTVLYNPATNTRIIYRVIYPSELSSGAPKKRVISKGTGRGRGRPRKQFAKKEEDVKSDGPELSKAEKEEKKKHRPRTRSGRISRPPSYMVKDYKRIHHLDFDEEPYDDSDGGYSDFLLSDEDTGEHEPAALTPGMSSTKPRKYKCSTCDKAYIGRGGLGRHYRLFPSHGKLQDVEDISSTHDENSNSSYTSTKSITSPQKSNEPSFARAMKHIGVEGRYPLQKKQSDESMDSISARRKSKLRESVLQCNDEELMEVVLPRLSRVLSLWEFLLIKCRKGNLADLDIEDILHNFEHLMRHLQVLVKQCLRPANSQEDLAETKHIQITNEVIAQVLGISAGTYTLKKPPQPITKLEESILPVLCKKVTIIDEGPLSIRQKNDIEEADSEREMPGSPPCKRQRNKSDSVEHQVEDSPWKSPADSELTHVIHCSTAVSKPSDNKLVVCCASLQTTSVRTTTDSVSTMTTDSTVVNSIPAFKISVEDKSMMQRTSDFEGSVQPSSEFTATGIDSQVHAKDTPEMGKVSVCLTNEGQTELQECGNGAETMEVYSSVQCPNAVFPGHHSNSSDVLMPAENKSLELEELTCSEEAMLSQQDTDGAIVRHLVLPDGQIVGTLSAPSSQLEDLAALSEQLSQGLLPGNVIIMQNADGSTTLQIPSDQPISLETVQAVLAMNSGLSGEVSMESVEMVEHEQQQAIIGEDSHQASHLQ